MEFENEKILSCVLEGLLKQYSVKEIVQVLSDICLNNASKMIDLELPDSAKEWSETSFIVQSITDQIKK
jgi:hypothetical protein